MNAKRGSWTKILSAVSDWMKLLTVICLLAESVILAAMQLAPTDDPMRGYYPLAMLLFLVVIVIGVFWDRYLQSRSRTDPPPPPPAAVPVDEGAKALVKDDEVESRLEKIRTSIRSAVALQIPILRNEIVYELDSLVVDARTWSHGELNTSVRRYRKVLLELYERAGDSIFSTTVPDYMVAWQEELMEGMILAGERSKANSITRVFVFNQWKDIDERSIAILTRFKRSSRIRTLVYIDQEDERFDFPVDVSKDFVVIDRGDAIGVTMSFGPESMRAQWYFGDEERKPIFARICDGLTRGSRDVDEILERWEKDSDRRRGQD